MEAFVFGERGRHRPRVCLVLLRADEGIPLFFDCGAGFPCCAPYHGMSCIVKSEFHPPRSSASPNEGFPTWGGPLGPMPLGFQRRHPGGMAENSPAFQRWDRGQGVPSPEGTAENHKLI